MRALGPQDCEKMPSHLACKFASSIAHGEPATKLYAQYLEIQSIGTMMGNNVDGFFVWVKCKLGLLGPMRATPVDMTLPHCSANPLVLANQTHGMHLNHPRTRSLCHRACTMLTWHPRKRHSTTTAPTPSLGKSCSRASSPPHACCRQQRELHVHQAMLRILV